MGLGQGRHIASSAIFSNDAAAAGDGSDWSNPPGVSLVRTTGPILPPSKRKMRRPILRKSTRQRAIGQWSQPTTAYPAIGRAGIEDQEKFEPDNTDVHAVFAVAARKPAATPGH